MKYKIALVVISMFIGQHFFISQKSDYMNKGYELWDKYSGQFMALIGRKPSKPTGTENPPDPFATVATGPSKNEKEMSDLMHDVQMAKESGGIGKLSDVNQDELRKRINENRKELE
jgi:hypothetical protein